MAISHCLALSLPAVAVLVRHCPHHPLPSSVSMSKIRISAFYPVYPQISSTNFIRNLPVATSAYPHFTIGPLYRLPHFTRTPATYSRIFHSRTFHVFSPGMPENRSTPQHTAVLFF